MNFRHLILLALSLAVLLENPVAARAASPSHPMAVLPSSRSLQIGARGSVFVTAINPTGQAFTNCFATLNNLGGDTGGFGFQRTDPQTNRPIGAIGDHFDIPPAGAQTWIQFLDPAQAHGTQEVQVDIVCDGFAKPAVPTVGVDTFAFSVDPTRPPDLVALAATVSGDGVARVPVNGTGAFAVATINLGGSGTITVAPNTGPYKLPVTMTLCQTDARAQCLAPPAASITTAINSGATPTFSVFVKGQGSLPFLPATNRAYLNLYDQAGTLRGRTSVAVADAATTTSASLSAAGTISASAFVDTIGVNTHIDFKNSTYQNLAVTEAAINYLGIKNLRDSAQSAADLTTWRQVAAATGAKFDDYMGEASPAQDLTDLGYVPTLAGQGVLNFVEGGNENDDAYAIAQGNSIAWTASFQQQVFATGRQLGLPVINMSFGAGWTAANNYHGNYDKVGDLSPFADYANAHTYPSATRTTNANIMLLNADALLAAGSRPVITTEIGWNNANFTQADVARFVLDAIYDGIKAADVKMYFYALFDDGSGQFGLMNQDGSPKPAGAALHNLTAIMADSGAARSDTLNYDLSGTTANDKSLLTEKSSGSFQLALWNESDAPHSVTLTLGAAAQAIRVYDPIVGSSPMTTYTNTGAITLTTTDHPLIIEIVPAS
ncbi:MAG: calcium-binding protein [Rhodospirillales bacterium]|nr:calcium-binding protein [Rhodospirillales bacterium]